jgi:hypothetical protein
LILHLLRLLHPGHRSHQLRRLFLHPLGRSHLWHLLHPFRRSRPLFLHLLLRLHLPRPLSRSRPLYQLCLWNRPHPLLRWDRRIRLHLLNLSSLCYPWRQSDLCCRLRPWNP